MHLPCGKLTRHDNTRLIDVDILCFLALVIAAVRVQATRGATMCFMAWMLAEMGRSVVIDDADPQCRLIGMMF